MLSETELNRLRDTAGVLPRFEWIQSLQQQDVTRNNNADEVLYSILHCDLREVTGGDKTTNQNALLLQNSIEESLRSLSRDAEEMHSTKSLLPTTFCHMVQVEELLDVSVNAQERLELGPADENSNHNKKRCLKMSFSDGYCSSMVAMETCPIPNISVNSLPGIKLLIQGSVHVRYGILLLNDGNTIVLGGSVPSLIPVRQKAMDAARKQAGIGIDPTIKALIWNTANQQQPSMEQEEEGYNDEDTQNNIPDIPMETDAGTTEMEHNHVQQQRAVQQQRTSTAIIANPHLYNHTSKNTASYNPPMAPSSLSSVTVAASANNPANNSRTVIVNPYRKTPSNNSSASVTDAIAKSKVMRPQTDQSWAVETNNVCSSKIPDTKINEKRSPIEPTSNSAAVVDLTDDDDPRSQNMDEQVAPMDVTPTYNANKEEENAKTTTAVSLLPSITNGNDERSRSADSLTGQIFTPTPASNTSTIVSTKLLTISSAVEPISFAELYSIYARISSSRELYEQLYQNDTTFIVPSKLRDKKDRGNLFNFSLGKRKQDLQDAATKKKQKGGDSRVCTCLEVNFCQTKKEQDYQANFPPKIL